MIQLKNVCKTYMSKSGQQVEALKDISFSLGDRGMTVILGKSGSGKSTLLNLLGGLDSATKGEITVDGVSVKQFQRKDFDGYRNGYVGFVFQEFNLLPDFNVRDNVALALQLERKTDYSKVVQALKSVGLSEEYMTRRVNELSGGEKQRVAIARCIVKNSKLILADEPTGNLDSATSEDIWNILKKLSETKLVVVVTHDRDSAERYSDRILEIADGKLISDSDPQSQEETHRQFVSEKLRLPFGVRFKMAWQSLFKRKFRAVSTILSAIFGAVVLVLVQMLLCFDPIRFQADIAKNYNLPFVVLRQTADDAEYRYSAVSCASRRFLDANCDYFVGNIPSGKQQMVDMGFEFVGETLELDNDSFYISQSYLDFIRDFSGENSYVLKDGQKIPLSQIEKQEELVGRQVFLSDDFNSESDLPVLAGIVADFDSEKSVYMDSERNFFVLKGFEHFVASSGSIVDTVSMGEESYNGTIDIKSEPRLSSILIQTGLIDTRETDFAINEGEVLLSFELYRTLFNDENLLDYYVTEKLGNYSREENQPLPEHIGETIDLKILDKNNDVIYDLGPRKLTGVILTSRYENDAIYLDGVSANKLLAGMETDVTVNLDSVKNLEAFLRQTEQYDLKISDMGMVCSKQGDADRSVVQIAEELQNLAHTLQWIFAVLGCILIVVVLLLTVNVISFSVTDKKKEIGIMTALGMSCRDAAGIFMLETSIIAVIAFADGTVMSLALTAALNALMYSAIIPVIPFLHFGGLSLAVIAAATFVLMTAATLFPLRRIFKLQPVDAIRNL